MTDKIKGVASGAVNGLKNAFVAVTAAVTATSAAVGVFAKQALDAYGNYEQLVGGVETLFKTSSDKVMEYANNAYKTAGMSANEYMETVTSFSASLLQGLGGDTAAAADLADQAIIDMSDNANKMGTDISMIQNAYQGFAKQNYTMLDNLKLGYGGTQAEMARLINDSGVLGDTIQVTASTVNNVSFDKIIEAIHVVQTNMGITGTTAAEAADTIEGSANAMKAAWGNLVTGIANENADLDTLIGKFISSAETAAGNIIPRIVQILSGMGQAIQQMAPILSEQIPALISGVLPALMSAGAQLLVGLITGIISALPSLAAAVPEIANALAASFTENAPVIAAAGLQLLDMVISGIQEGIPQLQAIAGVVFSNLIGFLQENLPQMISAGLSALLSFSQGLRENVGNLVDAAIELVKTLADGIIASLPDLIEKVPEIVSNLAGAINDNAPKLLLAAAELIAKLVQGIIQNIPVLIANAPKIALAIFDVITAFNWINLGKTIVTGIINGVKSLFGSVMTTAQTLVQNWRTVISDLPGYFKAIGRDMIQGLINGIKSMASSVVKSAKSIGTLAVNALKSALSGKSDKKTEEAMAKAISDSSKMVSDSMDSLAKSSAKAIGDNLKLADSGAKNVKAFESQANAMDRAKKSVSNYGTSSKAASKQIKTQAEKDLEEYKSLKAALDHQRTMDEISEEEYYRSLSELRDKYLSDEANISEYRKASEELHKIDTQNLEAEKKTFQEREKLRENFAKSAQNAAEQVLKLEENYQKELVDRTREIANSYKLFDEVPKQEKVSGNELLKNLEAQNKSIETFYANLDSLTDRDIYLADGLADEIRKMGVGAQDELSALLNMTDEQLQKYSDLYAEKQKMANEIAVVELSELRTETDQKIQEQIDSVKELYDQNAPELGFEFTQGIADGIRSGIADAVSAAIELAQAVSNAAKGELDINSPSRVGRDEIGKMLDAGIAEGIDDGTKEVVASANTLSRNLLSGVDISSITKQLKAAVEAESARLSAQLTISSNAPAEARAARDRTNAYQNAAANAAVNNYEDRGDAVINIDGMEFYRATLKSLRTVEDQTPRTVDDT